MSKRIGSLCTLLFAGLAAAVLSGCERPPVQIEQIGYRGTAMERVDNPRALAARRASEVVPEALAPAPAGTPGVGTVYKNVQVLGDLNVAEFTRLMVAITNWVSPAEGCGFCHAGNDFADDSLYTKVVSRRMLQMTRAINADWKAHVGTVGVTCYTCHRGQPVPANIWFSDPAPKQARGLSASRAGQNVPAKSVAWSALPYDPFSALLLRGGEIRIQPSTALPTGSRPASIVDTERTYGLMMHISDALGVNCTFCHNSQNFSKWDYSPPQRVAAWHGIRMTRALNSEYLAPLVSAYPPERLGPGGDAPKVNCATCHNGVNQPLYGVSMLKDHPELAAAKPSGSPRR